MIVLFKIAWRNLWRNPRRSWMLVAAIAVGVFAFLGASAFINAFTGDMVASAIELQGGHLQISPKGYHARPTVRRYIRAPEQVESVLRVIPGIYYAPLVASSGVATTAGRVARVDVRGVDPAREATMSSIAEAITDGRYLSQEHEKNEVILGETLARRLDVRRGEKVVLMLPNLDNEVSAGAFRVTGLYRTNSADFDRASVYVPLAAAQALLGYESGMSAYSVRLRPRANIEDTIAQIKTRLQTPGLEVLSWKERFPRLVFIVEVYDFMMLILVLILFTTIAFTIVNSFSMVIFERIREFGIMLACGVRPVQICLMLYLEASLITLMGMGIGLLVSAGLIQYWNQTGLNLSSFADGLSAFGIGSTVYPYLHWAHASIGLAMIVAIVLVAVLIPAIKASRFDPAEAISHV